MNRGQFVTTTVRGATALAVFVLLALGAGPAGAQPERHVDALYMAARTHQQVGIAPAPCADETHNFLGGKWFRTYKWSFNAAHIASGLRVKGARAKILEAFANITNANNDCGRPDRISARAEFLGTLSQAVNCREPDGHNVVGFGKLPFGVLAVTCFWIRNGRMVEADIKITNQEEWALGSRGRCSSQPVLEATLTHEIGHVFGLDHVSERRHGRLTMSSFLDGPCQNSESTLGLGDMLGLETLY